MLITLATCKERMGVTTTAHDAHITSLIGAAHDIVQQYVQQPIERTTTTHTAPCVAVPDSPLCAVRLMVSIDVTLDEVVALDEDITSLATLDADRNRILVPTDYEGAPVRVKTTSGWTPLEVPEVVTSVLCEITAHLYRSTALADVNLAGVASLSTSVSGVVTESRSYRDDYMQYVLSRLSQWRLNLW
ncbi:MAG: hypothetical protein KatS3mg038_1153 [Candidatus Kapaibacterium sp.]|nr:MAG: hypothetical protein KatS3mg038_1113 [Candidatus Kapabacteria bacterium]GIV50632.1 MAG: hypothetical protein KatS3mg038_1153 [Candidatus Kapabacteria bacterium]